jgi:sugar phosphate isomerase/epimerase
LIPFNSGLDEPALATVFRNHANSADRRLAVDALTLVGTSPPDVILAASAAGFDAVGVRVQSPDGAAPPWDMREGAQLLRRSQEAIAATGISVLGVEVVALFDRTQPADYEAALESGAALGATFVNVTGRDEDHARLKDTFAQLCEAAVEYGLSPQLEPMVYSTVRNISDALGIIADAPGWPGVQIDTLHLARFNGSLAQVAEIPLSRRGYLQIADGRSVSPYGTEALRDEARNRRVIPGQGDIDILSIADLFPTPSFISVEVPSRRGNSMAPETYLRELRRASLAVLSGSHEGWPNR